MEATQIKSRLTIIIFFGLVLSVSHSGNFDLAEGQNSGGTSTQTADSINLLDSKFAWKRHIQAKVFQTDGKGLDIVVDTSSKDKLYHRAYLDTEFVNLSKPPIALSLEYSYKSLANSTMFALEIKEMENDNKTGTTVAYFSLWKESAKAIIPLGKDIRNRPLEFRLYAITNEPTFCLLSIREAQLLMNL